MYCSETRRALNCNHKTWLYFQENSKWSKDDYCNRCLQIINKLETETV